MTDEIPEVAARNVLPPSHGNYVDKLLDTVDYDAIDADLKELAGEDSSDSKETDDSNLDYEEGFDDAYIQDTELETEDDDEDYEEDLDVDEDLEEDVDGNVDKDTKVSVEDFAKSTFELDIDGEKVTALGQELIDSYGMDQTSRTRFGQAAKMRQQSEEFIRIAQDRDRFLDLGKQMGHDIDTMVDNYIMNRLQYEEMSPEARRNVDLEQKNRQYEQQIVASKQQEESRRIDEMAKQYETDIKAEVISAMKATNLPNTKRFFVEVLNTIVKYKELGQVITASQAARFTKRDLQETLNGIFTDSESAEFDKILNAEGKAGARKARSAGARKRTNKNRRQSIPSVHKNDNKETRTKGGKPKRYEDFFKEL